MKWMKAALVGLVSGVVLTVAVFTVEVIQINRVTAAQVADCQAALNGGGGICSGYAQLGSAGLVAAFVVGFVFASGWFLVRTHRHPAL